MEGIEMDLDYDEDGTHQESVSTQQAFKAGKQIQKITYSAESGDEASESTQEGEESEENRRKTAEKRAKRFGIEPTVKIEVSAEDMHALCSDLRIQNGVHSARTVLVKGVDGMTKYTVEKIFAAFHPYRVEMMDDATALVMFTTKVDSAAMFIDMTKSLRRIKKHRPADEDGEVLSSDDEDGQLKDEAGDDVAVVMDGESKPSKSRTDVIEVDVREVSIPDGRWRVVTKHVPEKRLLLARYATTVEITDHRKNRVASNVDAVRKRRTDTAGEDGDGYTYNWSTDDKVRPGLNIFDNEGNELEWDYEHDTRFYDDDAQKTDADGDSKPNVIETKGAPSAIKIKGRGAKKGRFLYEGGGSTLASDDIGSSRGRSSMASDDKDSDVESEPDLDPTPTLQPWDRPTRLANRLRKKEW